MMITESDQVVDKLYRRRQDTQDAKSYQISARDLDLVLDHVRKLGEELRLVSISHNKLEEQRNALAAWVADMFSQDAVGYPFIMMREEDRERCSTTDGVISYLKEEMGRN